MHLKSFGQHFPYGNQSLCEKWLTRASLEKLLQLGGRLDPKPPQLKKGVW
jgi:hypothetical protein